MSKKQMVVADVDDVLAEYSPRSLEPLKPFARSIRLAQGMSMMRKALEPHMDDLLALRGSKLGYRTDKDDQEHGYSREEIRDALMEGMFRGALPVGNEINIIGGSCYLTKEYFERAFAELDGLTNLRIRYGTPQVLREPQWAKDERGKPYVVFGAAMVAISATWMWHGKPLSLECEKTDTSDTRIALRVNHRYSLDQLIGKAESKLLRRVYKQCTGSTWVQEDEVDVVPGEMFASEQEPPKIEQDTESFRQYVQRRVDRCETSEQLDVAYREMMEQNPDDEGRRKIIMDATTIRDGDLIDLAQ